MHVILLSAGVGRRLAPYTEARPKCLMEVDGTTLLERHLVHAQRLGAKNITVVTGHLAPMIETELARVASRTPVRRVQNDDYKEGSIVSLRCGLDGIEGDVIFMDTDVLYHPNVLGKLFQTKHRSSALIDVTSEESGEEMMIGVREGRAMKIARRVSDAGPWELMGESVGFFRIGAADLPALRHAIDETLAAGGRNQEYEAALDRLFKATPVGFERVEGLPWTEIDFAEDLQRARDEIAPALPPLHEAARATQSSMQ